MGIIPFLLGASIAAAPLPQATYMPSVAPAPRHPALWVVNDDDTIIYLFGTFHALDGKSRWFDQAVRTAFSASDELMLETLVPRPAAPMPARGDLTPYGGAQPGPVAQLAPSGSYLAATKLVIKAGRDKGLSTEHGADAVLRSAADESGKIVGGLESFEFQLNMFSSLQGATPGPARSPQAAQALGSTLAELQAAWSRGDVDRFAPMLRQMQAQSPYAYRTMFVERNARWAHWIAQRLKAPGTVFVAVGAGHLTGPDSVQNQLGTLGVRSARVN